LLLLLIVFCLSLVVVAAVAEEEASFAEFDAAALNEMIAVESAVAEQLTVLVTALLAVPLSWKVVSGS